MKPVKIGILGCGNISQAYFNGAKMFPILEVKGCADINPEAAKAKAEENECLAMSVEELLADPEIEIVVNLTIPAVHAEVSMKILEAGKNVHLEKPLAVSLEDGKKVIDFAESKGLLVGCAPDTFMGAGLQTCRKLIDDGWVGKALSGSVFMLGHGPESWHPNPAFFYQTGGGPMFDMGPYYMTGLVHLLGPVKSVTAVAAKGYKERLATCKQHFGVKLPVDVPTHYTGVIEHHCGALITATISFDVWAHNHPCFEIYGTEGSLSVPDPNGFCGPVKLRRPEDPEWREITLSHSYKENSRSIGAADMAYAIRTGRDYRCNGKLAYHVLEIMHAFEKSSELAGRYELESTCDQPKALPAGLPVGMLDE